VRHLINLIEKAQTEDLSELQSQGYDVSEILYHGSRRDLDSLEVGHGRTAHIYTSPDPRTASYYGAHIHILVAKQGNPADLTHANDLTRSLAEENYDFFIDCHEVEERLKQYDEAGEEMKISAAVEYTEAMILSGMMWERPAGGRTFQDRVLDEVFALDYTSARINDVSMIGAPLSVVFPNGDGLKIIDRKHWTLGRGID
jgi:hypothetical protein